MNGGGDKEQAEAWAFAMAMLPLIDNCDSDAAATVVTNMQVGISSPMADGWEVVKDAVEGVYSCLGVTCDDVGGLVDSYASDGSVDSYLFSPCVTVSAAARGISHSVAFTVGIMSAVGMALLAL